MALLEKWDPDSSPFAAAGTFGGGGGGGTFGAGPRQWPDAV